MPRPHYHRITPESLARGRTEMDYLTSHEQLGDMFDDFGGEEEELGQFGELLSMGAGLLGNLIGGGKKKKGGAPAPAAAPSDGASIVAALRPAIDAAGIPPASNLRNVSPEQMRTLVKELLATVPPPVRAQVSEALAQARAESGNTEAKIVKIVKDIDEKFQPQLQATIAALKLAEDQRAATSQHRNIVLNEQRWRRSQKADRNVDERLAEILTRMEAMGAHMEERLGGNIAIVKGRKRIDILGGARTLKKHNVL